MSAITIKDHIKKVKTASRGLVRVSDEVRNGVLRSLAQELRANTDRILEENAKDLLQMPKEDPLYDRLELTRERINGIAGDVSKVADLPSPVGRILVDKTRPNGLHLQKISVALGVIGVIYESRPNVTIDVFTLCFKSGNGCVLKGGKEAYYSNLILVEIIKKVLDESGLDSNIVYLMPAEREVVYELLNAVGLVDVCIPRGSQSLINFVRENAKIPVIETGAGIVHTYFDVSGDAEKGKKIIENAKTRRVSVCSALDTLVMNELRLKDLGQLVEELGKKGVEIFADEKSYEALDGGYPDGLLKKARPEDFGTEFLSYKMSIKTVENCEEAVAHIMEHTSGHSEALVAEDPVAIEYFLNNVDAAAVYVNASTAFTDGGEFGMGAEIGISTQKLHARGPMGLEELTSYKWVVSGDGQIRP